MWTVERVKAELPAVPVRDEETGAVEPWALRGRKLPLATLTAPDGRRCEVAWATVVHCLNENRPVLF
jgi:hypothetical protein